MPAVCNGHGLSFIQISALSTEGEVPMRQRTTLSLGLIAFTSVFAPSMPATNFSGV